MDFYHLLPSNTSPTYFPNNNASEYSTPLDNPYDLTGNWEVALTDFTYSTCVNTFNNDNIFVDEIGSIIQLIQQTKSAVKVMLPVPTNQSNGVVARREIQKSINSKLESLLQLSVRDDNKFADWKLVTKDYYFILSNGIRLLFEIWSDVLSSRDSHFANIYPFAHHWIPSQQSDVYIIVVPVTPSPTVITLERVTLKEKDEKITFQELEKRFQSKVTPGVAKLTLNEHGQFRLIKLHDDNNMIIANSALRHALTVPYPCMFRAAYQQYLIAEFDNFDEEWIFSIVKLKTITTFHNKLRRRTITLPPHMFTNAIEAASFVTENLADKRITLKCNTATQLLTLAITDSNLTVTFDNNLRDIFGFDKNTYSGNITVTADRAFSLKRCIQFLYIYSNLTEYVRIGNTESPLIAVVPFSTDNDCSLLKQKTFKTPMYINVRHQERISQIDIAIYDGAGQLVPFVSDAVSTLRLHFRQT